MHLYGVLPEGWPECFAFFGLHRCKMIAPYLQGLWGMNLILCLAHVDQMHFCKMPLPRDLKVDPGKFACIGIFFWDGLCKFSAEPTAD